MAVEGGGWSSRLSASRMPASRFSASLRALVSACWRLFLVAVAHVELGEQRFALLRLAVQLRALFGDVVGQLGEALSALVERGAGLGELGVEPCQFFELAGAGPGKVVEVGLQAIEPLRLVLVEQ